MKSPKPPKPPRRIGMSSCPSPPCPSRLEMSPYPSGYPMPGGVIRSRMRITLVTAIAFGSLFVSLHAQRWWLSKALPRTLQQAGVNLDWDGSGPPTPDELVESGVNLGPWLAPLPVHMIVSLQIDAIY